MWLDIGYTEIGSGYANWLVSDDVFIIFLFLNHRLMSMRPDRTTGHIGGREDHRKNRTSEECPCQVPCKPILSGKRSEQAFA